MDVCRCGGVWVSGGVVCRYGGVWVYVGVWVWVYGCVDFPAVVYIRSATGTSPLPTSPDPLRPIGRRLRLRVLRLAGE